MKTTQPAELKQIVHEVIGTVASKMLLGRVYAILDEENKDPAAQKQTCSKIEKMVSLFIGPDKAQILEKRFKETLR
jgi:hypothetical protein